MPPPNAYTFTRRVAPEEIDAQNHVNNVAYLQYVQDAAVKHWFAVAPADVVTSVAWVVRRHEIEYRKPGFAGDELEIKTWVGEPTAATWERFTEIKRASDGDLLVSARTVWVLIDAVTRRPRRVDAAFKAIFPAAFDSTAG
jgi:acyl-CoA thioester hydrolase